MGKSEKLLTFAATLLNWLNIKDRIMQLLWICLVVILVIFTLMIVHDVAESKEGCSAGSAIFLSIFFTPIAGLLYCLNFPTKTKEKKENEG